MAAENSILAIIKEEELSRFLREKLLVELGYAVHFESDTERALAVLRQDGFDIVLLSFKLIDADAESLIKEIRTKDPYCVIIAFVEDPNPAVMDDLLRMGIYDFIGKPVNMNKLFFVLQKGLQLRSLMLANAKLMEGLKEHNVALEKQNTLLARRVEESTTNLSKLYEDLRSTYMRTIKVLAQAIDARDHYTHSHSENVAQYAVVIAREIGLPAKEIEILREACELHDLGKIGVEDNILSKPFSLTPQEWEQIKRHPAIGAKILEPLTFLSDVIELVRQHHEHFDGSGYPDGRQGEDILLGARIIHLADAYESMRSARSYRKIPLTKEEAILEVKRNSGTQFDPGVVEHFLKIVDRL
ncbi:MAG TPA: HD domain-containing phosphohydrolase [Candidatus Margulisiibacteriota bacterium]|nr:HD domain-containing phosphohydrolase [Candidatus Margulisiibacteriota bacterium]